MKAIGPEDIVENMLQAGAMKACLTVKDMLVRGFLSGVFLGLCNDARYFGDNPDGTWNCWRVGFSSGFCHDHIAGPRAGNWKLCITSYCR